MRRVTALTTLMRRLRAERGVMTFLFILVAITSLVVAISPRLFDRMADDGLRYDVARATVVQRDVEFTRVGQLGATDSEPLAGTERMLSVLGARLPAAIQAIVGDRHYVIDGPRFEVTDPPNYPTYVSFRYQDGLDGRIVFVEGRSPASVAQPVDPEAAPRFEIALAKAAATETKIKLGDHLTAAADMTDPLMRDQFRETPVGVDIEVVGLFDVKDVRDPYWFGDVRLARAAIGGSADNPIAFTTGLIAPDAFPDLVVLDLPARYRWRYFIDPSRLDQGQLAELIPGLRRLRSDFSASAASDPSVLIMRTGLGPIIDRFVGRTDDGGDGPVRRGGRPACRGCRRHRPRRDPDRGAPADDDAAGARARRIGQPVAPGPACRRAARDRPGRARGSARRSGPGPRPPERPVGPRRDPRGACRDCTPVAGDVAVVRRPRRAMERDDVPMRRRSLRRLVLEALVIGLAVAGAWLLRERGLSAEDPGGDARAFDPFLALTPILIGVAVALVLIRLYPIPVRAFSWLAAQRRDLVAVLGLRTIARNPRAAYLPLLVLTLTVAIGTFTSVVRVTIDRGQVDAAWHAVGADYRIEAGGGGSFDPSIDPTSIPGVEAAAPIYRSAGVSIATAPGRIASTVLVAVDAPAYEVVVAGSPVAVQLPPALHVESAGRVDGTVAAPIPAVVSTRPPTGSLPFEVGDTFTLTIQGTRLTFRVAEVADAFLGTGPGIPFVVAPLGPITTATKNDIEASTYLVRGGDGLASGLQSLVAGQASEATVDSRFEQYATAHDAPLVSGVIGGFGLSLAIALVYALVGGHRGRRPRRATPLPRARLPAHARHDRAAGRRTDRRGAWAARSCSRWRSGSASVSSVAWLLEPGLGLEGFIGPERRPCTCRWTDRRSRAVVLAVVVVVIMAVITSAWLARRFDLGRVMRIGDE